MPCIYHNHLILPSHSPFSGFIIIHMMQHAMPSLSSYHHQIILQLFSHFSHASTLCTLGRQWEEAGRAVEAGAGRVRAGCSGQAVRLGEEGGGEGGGGGGGTTACLSCLLSFPYPNPTLPYTPPCLLLHIVLLCRVLLYGRREGGEPSETSM